MIPKRSHLRKWRYFSSLSLLLVLTSHTDVMAADSSATKATAEQILERVAKTYATCKSYMDSGVVKSVNYGENANDNPTTSEEPFTTAFVRPDRFRFEFKETMGHRELRYIVWCNGSDVRNWWDLRPRVTRPKSLGMALAGPTGISGGSAHVIPRLLFPKKVVGWSVTNMLHLERIDDGISEGVECFRLKGYASIFHHVVWIDKKSFLVRRVDEKIASEEGAPGGGGEQKGRPRWTSVSTIIYRPIINQKVDEELLRFDPPTEK